MLRIIHFAVLLLVSTTLASAQITGSLYGTVTDPAGAVIPNAQVTATSVERGNVRSAVSNGLGQWVLTELPLGAYAVKIEVAGFKAFDRKGITLNAEANIKLDAKLEIGSATEAVTVTAE